MEDSIIHDTGAISLVVKPSEVTWFAFLGHSRVTNSKSGGWNSKTHWRSRGLERLMVSGVIEQWTKNTLKEDVMPKPREGGFRFDRVPSNERSALLRNDHLSSGCREDALNASMFYKPGELEEFGLWDHWGYEIPLAEDRDGQLKADLYCIHNDNRVGVIELKRAENKSDSPLLALTEAICYGLQTLRCQASIKKEMKLPTRWEASEILLILAAPKDYWSYWGADPDGQTRVEFTQIVDRLNSTLANKKISSSFKLKTKVLRTTLPLSV